MIQQTINTLIEALLPPNKLTQSLQSQSSHKEQQIKISNPSSNSNSSQYPSSMLYKKIIKAQSREQADPKTVFTSTTKNQNKSYMEQIPGNAMLKKEGWGQGQGQGWGWEQGLQQRPSRNGQGLFSEIRGDHTTLKSINVQGEGEEIKSSFQIARQRDKASRSQIYIKSHSSKGTKQFAQKQKPKSKTRQRPNSVNYKYFEYQKRNMQVMATNNMNQLMSLIKQQTQHKKLIFDLKNVIRTLQKQNSNTANIFTLKQTQYINKIHTLKKQNKQLQQNLQASDKRVRQLQLLVIEQETQIRKYKDEIRRIEDAVVRQKQEQVQLGISLRMALLEREMAVKDRDIERRRYQGLLGEGEFGRSVYEDRIRVLEAENMDLKMKIQALSANKEQKIQIEHINVGTNTKKTSITTKKQSPQLQNIYKLHQTKIQNILKQFRLKLNSKDNQPIINQLKQLKTDIQKIKDKNQSYQTQKNFLQKRIVILEKRIQDENSEKCLFLEELSKIIKKFEELEVENRELKGKLSNSQNSIYKRLEEENQGNKRQRVSYRDGNTLNVIADTNANSNKDKDSYTTKLNNTSIQQLYLNIQRLYEQNCILKQKIGQLQQKVLKKQTDQKIKIQDCNYDYSNSNRISNNSNNPADENKYPVVQSVSSNTYNLVPTQNPSNEPYQQPSVPIGTGTLPIHFSYAPAPPTTYYQTLLSTLQTQYQSKLALQQLHLSNVQHSNQILKQQLKYVQSQRLQLIRKLKAGILLNQTVDHLWRVKEIQYGNVVGILGQIGKPDLKLDKADDEPVQQQQS